MLVSATLIQIKARQPSFSIIMPLSADPTPLPIRGINVIRLMAVPLWSGSKMSPIIAGLKTFDAVDMPIKAREAMRSVELGETAANMVARKKTIFNVMIKG
jgi:hypothetical protein